MLLNQVNKFFSNRKYIHSLYRYVQRKTKSTNILYSLESRRLLKVSGDEVSEFLQGLVTNDMRHFDEGTKSIYTMFLNTKGRVLYETLIHKLKEANNSFIVECDKNVLSSLQKHLKTFKLRRILDIEDISEDFSLWAFVTPLDAAVNSVSTSNDICVYKDPRLENLGFRIIASKSLTGCEIAKSFNDNIVVQNNEDDYKYLRYKLGVSEGVDDLPPGLSFPLEANCDYLHGVSFHKGCYIGQEVTARVHHTGVVRKRLMPLQFVENIQDPIKPDTAIVANDNPKSNVGKLKGHIKNYGLGLLRIKEAMEAESLTIGQYKAKVIKPSWWPVEAPKEKLNILKTD